MAATTIAPDIEALLAAATESHRAETMAAARTFELAAAWAEANPGDDVVEVLDDEGNLIMFGDQPLSLAGEGAPTVSEFSIAQFAAAVGMPTQAGRKYVGAAVEARHRLPRIWAKVLAGEVPVWKARRITEHTHALPPEGAGYVDRQLVEVAHTCSFAQIERVAGAAALEFSNDRVEEDRQERWTQQHLDLDFDSVTLNDGLVPISGLLDPTDALALEKALQADAHTLLGDHPDLDLDIRRAMALGRLADHALTGSDDTGARELVIYTHHDTRESHGLVDLEATRSPITVEHLAEWCQHAGTRVTIRPVLDLDEEIHTDAYHPTPRQREQAILTCPTCVFPGCGRPARRCDLDHIIPWPIGPTDSWNLAPLCRLHHRIKTYGGWTYRRLTRTRFEWTDPTGRTYDVDLTHKRRRTR